MITSIMGLTMLMIGACIVGRFTSNLWAILGCVLIYLGTVLQFSKVIFKK